MVENTIGSMIPTPYLYYMKQEQIFTGSAIYTNTATKETYTLKGVSDLGRAWELVKFAASRNNWNTIDITLTFKP